MSKSLKNFSTIKEYLSEYSYREIRFLFLLGHWDTVMNFNPETGLKEARAKDHEFKSFFRTVKSVIKLYDIKTNTQKFSAKDFELQKLFYSKKDSIHHHLCNNFNTMDTIDDLSQIVSATSIYMQTEKEIKSPLLKEISKYVLFIFKVLGFVKEDEFGYENNGSGNTESLITPIMDTLRDFRLDVKAVISGKEIVKKDVFKVLDELRDQKLPNLGIKLEDRKDGSIWSYVDRETLLKEIREEEE